MGYTKPPPGRAGEGACGAVRRASVHVTSPPKGRCAEQTAAEERQRGRLRDRDLRFLVHEDELGSGRRGTEVHTEAADARLIF